MLANCRRINSTHIVSLFNNLRPLNYRFFNSVNASSLHTEPTPDDSTASSLGPEDEQRKESSQNPVKLIQHTFNWGIGNKYIEQSRNRIRPTHKPKVTTVTISSNYFDLEAKFDNCKVVYDELNEQWEVLWLEFNKLNGRPFPVKKYGIQASKLKSLEFAHSLNERLKNSTDTTMTDETTENEKNVVFDNVFQSWIGLGRCRDRPIARAYSSDFHGYEQSKQLSKTLTKSR